MEEIITGLDIGTSKVCAVIGYRTEDNELEILGLGISPNYGLKKGVIVNIDSTVEAIKLAIEEAELMAGVEVSSVYVGISGTHMTCMNSQGVVAIPNREREVTSRVVERAIETAQALNIPSEKEILHVLPWEFKVDEQDGIRDPAGMVGVRLEANVHIVTAASTAIQNVIKAVNRAGLEVIDIVLEPLASAESILTDDEREIGCLVIDIGGGTTDTVMILNGSLRHTMILGVGGKNVTKDISIGLRIQESLAEQIKLNYGAAIAKDINPNEFIEIPAIGFKEPRRVPRYMLCDIIEPRMEEIFTLIYKDISKTSMMDLIAGGIVLSGGASQLEGIVDLAERIFDMPVRIGYPYMVQGLKNEVHSPVYSTAVGLALYGLRVPMASGDQYMKDDKNFFGRMKSKISHIAKEFFA